MFYIAGISITFFLTFLLLGKKGKSVADYILATWLIFMGAHLSLYYLTISETVFDYPALVGIHIPLPLVHGPFLYLYTLALCGRLRKTWKAAAIHFALPLISYIYMSGFFSLPAAEKIFIFKHAGVGYERFMFINLMSIFASGILYVILSYRALSRHRINIRQHFSYEEKINLNWLRNIIYGIGIIWLMVLFGNDKSTYISVVLFIFFIGYFGLRQSNIFSSTQIKNDDEEEVATFTDYNQSIRPVALKENSREAEKEKIKYSKSGLSAGNAEILHRELQRLMLEEKLFQDPELALQKLAERMNTHPNYVSQLINEKEGMNFYEYVNRLRIDEFIRLASVPENRNFTLLSLALDCGFNSKSSFNKYFRKITGQSPTDYFQSQETISAAV